MFRLFIVFAGLMLCLSSSGQQVTVYRDCNFRGASISMGPGNYTGNQLGVMVRDISSINIPAGYVVNLFSQDFFNGNYISLNTSSSCLLNQLFSKRTVSMQVIYMGSAANTPPISVYRLCNYVGRAEEVTEGTYNSYASNFNGILSIRVTPGYAVLFRRETRIGNSVSTVTEEYRSDKACLPFNWGSTVKDAYVYRLNNVYDGYWDNNNNNNNNNPGNYTNFNQGAVAYGDINYRGRAQAMHIGAYRSYQLGQVGDQNISSLMIAPGYRVIAFSGPDFDGSSNVFTNSVTNMHTLPISWGNRIRSLIVERLGQPTAGNVVVQPPVQPQPIYPGGVVVNPQPGSIAQVPPGTPNNMVTVYAGSYYAGAKWSFQPGRYRASEILMVGARNISSLVVPPGFRVIAYTGDDFNGRSRVITSTIQDLVAEGAGWNKAISSMVIERTDPGYVNPGNAGSVVIGGQPNGGRPMPTAGPTEVVMAYADAFYQGSAQRLDPGAYRGSQLIGTPPRTMSSIRIPPGYKVTVYDGPNFDGDFRVLTYSIDNFVAEGNGRWNDRVSSLIVERL
jgi:hypothetical protein